MYLCAERNEFIMIYLDFKNTILGKLIFFIKASVYSTLYT